jgi:simple sugar transport system permease protein
VTVTGAVASWRINLRRLLLSSSVIGPLATWMAIFLLFSVVASNFLSLRTVSGILNAATLTGVVTIGVTLLMISGEFDLSVGSMMAIGGYLFGQQAAKGTPLLGLLLALLIPAVLGALNGLILIATRIPSFIVTLGTRSIYRGLAWIISGGALLQLTEDLPIYEALNGRLEVVDKLFEGANFRTSLVWLLGLLLLVQYLLIRTDYGNHVFAAGGNRAAAAAQGVNIPRVKLVNFIITGTLAGFAGVLLFSQFKTVRVATGAGTELSAIAAAVVGGALLRGGSGSIWGALVGVLLISTLRTGVILLNIPFIPADNFEAVVGVAIIGAVVFNDWLRRRA